jgi:hypothetical protein
MEICSGHLHQRNSRSSPVRRMCSGHSEREVWVAHFSHLVSSSSFSRTGLIRNVLTYSLRFSPIFFERSKLLSAVASQCYCVGTHLSSQLQAHATSWTNTDSAENAQGVSRVSSLPLKLNQADRLCLSHLFSSTAGYSSS